MIPAYESVLFIPAELQFVESTMRAYSQNQAVGGTTDNGAAVSVNRSEIQTALDILSKVRAQITEPTVAIKFTQPEAQLMQYLYNNYLQGHGKPQGDLDWTYYIRFSDSSAQLIINVMKKIGCNVSNLPASTYPQGYNPWVRL